MTYKISTQGLLESSNISRRKRSQLSRADFPQINNQQTNLEVNTVPQGLMQAQETVWQSSLTIERCTTCLIVSPVCMYRDLPKELITRTIRHFPCRWPPCIAITCRKQTGGNLGGERHIFGVTRHMRAFLLHGTSLYAYFQPVYDFYITKDSRIDYECTVDGQRRE